MAKLWTYDFDDGEFFVADSAEEADEMLKNHTGENLEEMNSTHGIDYAWESVDDSKVFTFILEEEENGLEPGKHQKTVAEWCVWNGKGYFCSRNYLPQMIHGLRGEVPATSLRTERLKNDGNRISKKRVSATSTQGVVQYAQAFP